jgi:glycosyltransferase involved in cell wall biosynthesis
VTVILPTYNRSAFLPAAFESIARQTFEDWNLVVVDDGSTDDTRAVVADHTRPFGDRVQYIYQRNQGAYAARNRGLDVALGEYVAFFDSDDIWLPHHLVRCVTALRKNPDIDWVFGACQLIDLATGTVLEPNTFYVAGQPRPFLALRTRRSGDLRVITDPAALECQLSHGLYCGLQNSVIKRTVFAGKRFNDTSRVVDDELFVIRALAAGRRFAYFMEPHVLYNVHSENSSGSAVGWSAEKQVAIFRELTDGLEQLRSELTLTSREHRALLKRLGHEYFWRLGYVGFWQAGRRREALAMFKRGLAAWPWQPAAWKTYLLARLRVAAQPADVRT